MNRYFWYVFITICSYPLSSYCDYVNVVLLVRKAILLSHATVGYNAYGVVRPAVFTPSVATQMKSHVPFVFPY